MSDGRYAIVRDGRVANLVLWLGEPMWRPLDGEAIAAGDEVEIGWIWTGERFLPPPDRGRPSWRDALTRPRRG